MSAKRILPNPTILPSSESAIDKEQIDDESHYYYNSNGEPACNSCNLNLTFMAPERVWICIGCGFNMDKIQVTNQQEVTPPITPNNTITNNKTTDKPKLRD
jgi:hypothetical protein